MSNPSNWKIVPGVYETRNRTLVGVSEVRESGFIEGQTLSGIRTIWAPGGWWLGYGRESQMDLIMRVDVRSDRVLDLHGRRQRA